VNAAQFVPGKSGTDHCSLAKVIHDGKSCTAPEVVIVLATDEIIEGRLF